jgi:hypothetical protein
MTKTGYRKDLKKQLSESKKYEKLLSALLVKISKRRKELMIQLKKA